MENSIENHIEVWRKEGKPHARAMEIVDLAIKHKLVKPFFKTIVDVDCPFSNTKLEELFQQLNKALQPRKLGFYADKDLPQALQELQKKIKLHYGLIAQLKGVLIKTHYTDTGKHRRSPNIGQANNLAQRIIDLDQENRAAWEQLNYFNEHGQEMPGTKPSEMPTELKRAAQLLDEQIEAVNYIRKEKSHQKKTGSIRNPEEFRRRQDILKEIDQFKKTHG